MVEDEDRGALLLEVLLPHHIEVDAVDGQQQLREGRREHIDTAPPTTGQQAPTDRRVGRGNHRSHAQQAAHLTEQSAAAAALELQDGPAALAGHFGHLVAGIGWSRIAHQVHQRDVFVAIGVEITVLEVDIVLSGELLHRIRLTRAPNDGLNHLAGEYAVVVDLEPVGHCVGDAEVPGHRFYLNRQSRRTEHHGVSALHVRVHQIAHLRIDPLLNLLGEQTLTDLLKVAERSATQGLGGFTDQLLELHESQLVIESGGDHGDQFAHAHIAVAQPFAGEDHRGEPRDQRAVEVEEGSDLGPGRACLDLGDRSRQPRAPGRCAVLVAHE